jgi:hypothetical protein
MTKPEVVFYCRVHFKLLQCGCKAHHSRAGGKQRSAEPMTNFSTALRQFEMHLPVFIFFVFLQHFVSYKLQIMS